MWHWCLGRLSIFSGMYVYKCVQASGEQSKLTAYVYTLHMCVDHNVFRSLSMAQCGMTALFPAINESRLYLSHLQVPFAQSFHIIAE